MIKTFYCFLSLLAGLALAQERLKVGDPVAFHGGRSIEVGIVKVIGAQDIELSPVVGFIRFDWPTTQGSKKIPVSQIFLLTETNPNLLNKFVRVGNIEGRVRGTFAEKYLWLRGIDDTSIIIDHTISTVAVELSSYEGIQYGSKVRWKEDGSVRSGVVRQVYSDGTIKVVREYTVRDERPRFIMWDQLILGDPCSL